MVNIFILFYNQIKIRKLESYRHVWNHVEKGPLITDLSQLPDFETTQ